MMPVNIEDFRRLAPGAACLTWFSTTWMAASVTRNHCSTIERPSIEFGQCHTGCVTSAGAIWAGELGGTLHLPTRSEGEHGNAALPAGGPLALRFVGKAGSTMTERSINH